MKTFFQTHSNGLGRSVLADQRRSQLLELVRIRGFAALPELATQLEVSESTIRRDLEHLEDAGSAKRTHGGVFYTGAEPKLSHFDQAQSKNWDKKKEIAQLASSMVEDGDVVLLDGGSTTYELARVLVGRPLKIVTNSLPVATLFSASERTELVFVGGHVHSHTGVAIGPLANQMLASLNCNRAFLSVAGVHEEGLYNSNLLLVETERAMMKSADQVVIVADSTKFGHKSLAKLEDLNSVDLIIADSNLSEDWRSRLIAKGIGLKIAGPKDNG